MIKVDYANNPKGYRNMSEVEVAAGTAASIMKLMCGVGNNATYEFIRIADEKLKGHPAYKGRVKHLYGKVFKDWRRYEYNLLNATVNRFFHVDDMPDAIRKQYGDITDRQYFEYWMGLGADVYVKTKPLVTSLTNKFRLSLENHKIPYPEITAWALTGTGLLELACHMFDMAVDSCRDVTGIRRDILARLFRPLLLRDIANAWNNATDELAPGVRRYCLDEFEAKNIEISYGQIAEQWTNPVNVYDSAYASITYNTDVFRSKNAVREALIEINQMKDETVRERRRIRLEQLAAQGKEVAV